MGLKSQGQRAWGQKDQGAKGSNFKEREVEDSGHFINVMGQGDGKYK